MSRTGPSLSWLAYWLDAGGNELPPGDAKALRAVLAAQGVSARGARLYLDYGDRLFAPLGPVWIQRHDCARSRASAIAWLKLLQACELDFKGVRLIPLTSEAALADEGEVMAHCIADYFWPNTLGKDAQVYSARDPRTLERLATVALVLGDDGNWGIDDVKAKSNRDAAPAVHAAAQALVTTINIRAARKRGVKA